MVYELYGVTEEHPAIVERAEPVRGCVQQWL